MGPEEPSLAASVGEDDDIPPMPSSYAMFAALAAQPYTAEERAATEQRYNISPAPITYDDLDPLSPLYARTSIDETPGTVMHFWFGYAADRPALLADRQMLWFRKSFETDQMIEHRFADLLAKLASGEARRWAAMGARERLAAVVVLDQFSRNIFRNLPAAFENDALALQLAKDGIARGEDLALKPVERWFLYMPLTHSESSSDQRRSVDKFAALAAVVPDDQREPYVSAWDFAKRHAAIVRKFGRFPHRNALLGRTSTSAERAFVAKPGSGF